DGAVPLLKHVWEELLHEIEQRVQGERQIIPGALGRQVSCGDEVSVRGWGVVERVEVADLAADLLGQCEDGTGVGQVGADDVHRPAPAGQVRGQPLERFPSAGYEDDVVALPGVAMSNGLTEARSCPEHRNGLGHDGRSSNPVSELT